MNMRYNDIREGWGDREKAEFKRKEMEHELGHEDKLYGGGHFNNRNRGGYPKPATVIKMTHLHYFNIPEAEILQWQIAGIKLKQDKKANWYLPQYNTSGQQFTTTFRSLTDTYGKPRSVTLSN